jgi:putative DNA-invertase from lambdoid prophage Rac
VTPNGERVWAYIRASTARQVDSPEVQRGAINAYVAKNIPDSTVDGYFVDAATSGTIPISEREAGKDMISRLKKGDCVVVMKLDRAFRRLSDAAVMIDRMQATGVHLHVVNLMGGSVDLATPIGKFIAQLLSAFAELDRAFILERTAEGRARRKAQGRPIGGPPLGYKSVNKMIDGKPAKIIVPDKDARGLMRYIAYLREKKCMTYDQIRQHLNYEKHLKWRGKEFSYNAIWRIYDIWRTKIKDEEDRLNPSHQDQDQEYEANGK